jgi:hypothetical protein
MVIATAIAFVGIAAYFGSNTSFNMLSLSNQFVAATSSAQQSIFLAAGQAMLAVYTGTAFQLNYIVGAVAFIMISFVMLKTNIFSKPIAYLGIAANIIALGLYVPKVGIYISVFSVLFLWIWYILIARRFFQLSKEP